MNLPDTGLDPPVARPLPCCDASSVRPGSKSTSRAMLRRPFRGTLVAPHRFVNFPSNQAAEGPLEPGPLRARPPQSPVGAERGIMRISARRFSLWAVVLLAALLPGHALAQERTGEILGVVTDESGAPVPGALVRAE